MGSGLREAAPTLAEYLPEPPNTQPTPSAFSRAQKFTWSPAGPALPQFSFQALPCRVAGDELIPPWYCGPLDSAWKPILGDQTLSSPTSLPDLGKSKQ